MLKDTEGQAASVQDATAFFQWLHKDMRHFRKPGEVLDDPARENQPERTTQRRSR
jgi:hypothetical protein